MFSFELGLKKKGRNPENASNASQSQHEWKQNEQRKDIETKDKERKRLRTFQDFHRRNHILSLTFTNKIFYVIETYYL